MDYLKYCFRYETPPQSLETSQKELALMGVPALTYLLTFLETYRCELINDSMTKYLVDANALQLRNGSVIVLGHLTKIVKDILNDKLLKERKLNTQWRKPKSPQKLPTS